MVRYYLAFSSEEGEALGACIVEIEPGLPVYAAYVMASATCREQRLNPPGVGYAAGRYMDPDELLQLPTGVYLTNEMLGAVATMRIGLVPVSDRAKEKGN